MKRKLRIKYSHLWRIHPLFFWKKCFICEQEFVREQGWRAYTEPTQRGYYTERFICHECGINDEKVNEFLLNHRLSVM